jgi:hypothetical protein
MARALRSIWSIWLLLNSAWEPFEVLHPLSGWTVFVVLGNRRSVTLSDTGATLRFALERMMANYMIVRQRATDLERFKKHLIH